MSLIVVPGNPVADYPDELRAVGAAQRNGASGTFGTDRTSWDLTGIAGDTEGGFRLTLGVLTASASANTIAFRVNGAKTGLSRSGFYGAFGATPTMASSADSNTAGPNGTSGVIGARFDVIIHCDNPSSAGNGPRLFHVFTTAWTNPTTRVGQYQYWMMTYSGSDEIVSVGIEGTVATGLGANSTYKLVRL